MNILTLEAFSGPVVVCVKSAFMFVVVNFHYLPWPEILSWRGNPAVAQLCHTSGDPRGVSKEEAVIKKSFTYEKV